MVNKRGREGRVQGRGVLRKKSFLSFTRCSRRSFSYVDGVLDDGRDGVMFLLALRHLRRYLFVYLSSKLWTSCFNAGTSGWEWGSTQPRTPHTQARGSPPRHPHAAPTAREASTQECALWGWRRVPMPAPPAPTASG